MRFFKPEEFLCKCGRPNCDAVKTISDILVEKLDTLRESIARPIVITSALRCVYKNTQVGGAEDSAHLRGEAADILVNNNVDRFELERHILCHPAPLFNRIGHARAHLHVDVGSLAINMSWIESGT